MLLEGNLQPPPQSSEVEPRGVDCLCFGGWWTFEFLEWRVAGFRICEADISSAELLLFIKIRELPSRD